MFTNKVVNRLKNDRISVFILRIIFFFVRHFFEFYDYLKYFFLKRKFLHSSKGHYISRRVNDVMMSLNLNDPGISKDLLLLGIREPNNTKLLKEIVNEGDVVVDIGANIGYFALLEAKLTGSTGFVYAVEPIPGNVKMLKGNIQLNRYHNIGTYEYAIGDATKNDFIFLSHKSNWCSMLQNSDVVDEQRKIPVQVVTLDDFIRDKKFPNLIRMDAEGYEVQIIAGMKNIIASGRPLKILMELHCVFLDDLGFGLISYLINNNFKIRLFFRDTPLTMVNKPGYIKKAYYWLGEKIGGIYEFQLRDTSLDELKKISHILREEVFHIYFERI